MATLVLAAIGFVLAIGRYDVGAYLWIEARSWSARSLLARRVLLALARAACCAGSVPLLRTLRLERPLRAVYEGVHVYRGHVRLLVVDLVLTLVVQAVRVLAIWLAGQAVGVELSPRPYYVMGPLLFLVMLVPFTINGLAVREAFFVSFLGQLGVEEEAAFATGFLFFVVTVGLALPGAIILAVENLRGVSKPPAPELR